MFLLIYNKIQIQIQICPNILNENRTKNQQYLFLENSLNERLARITSLKR
jgi:hypothetical protein